MEYKYQHHIPSRMQCFNTFFIFYIPRLQTSPCFLHSTILFSVPGIIGCLQALEAIKIATEVGEPLSGRMLLLDSLSARIRIVCFTLKLMKFSI
jgi:adenylyltransferase/sulfurtransferase